MTKQELASKIWETANSLRSNIKSSEYKDYILGFMFYKYLSDKEELKIKEAGDTLDILSNPEGFEAIQSDLGYCFKKENLFSELFAAGSKIGASDVNNVITQFNKSVVAEETDALVDIFSTLQSGLSKLGKDNGSRDKAVRAIINLVSDIPTTNKNYDVLGYIYEFLIYKFSTAAKDDGAFYTPHEVSSLIARVTSYDQREKKELSVYDPTCGSGSLLLNIGAEAKKYMENKDNIIYYGQEKISETYNLTRMNLFMKNVDAANIKVRCGDTLEQDWPYFSDKEAYKRTDVDIVVSNPPYSQKWKPEHKENDPRFIQGLAPSSKADYAFLQHSLYHLKPDGIMGIVLPHGILFRGGTEGEIRKNLINSNNIDTIIGLPANLFYATGIPTIVMFLKKNKTNSDILFIDASQSFAKDKTQNVLRESDIKRIYDAVIERRDIANFARVVSKEEVIANDYNLNIPRYVSATEETENYELYSLMTGGISDKELNKFSAFWGAFPTLKDELFEKDSYGFNVFKVKDIKESISNNEEVKAFKAEFEKDLKEFYKVCEYHLLGLKDKPNVVEIKDALVERLFALFSQNTLVDKYSIYEVFTNVFKGIESNLDVLSEDGIDAFRMVDVLEEKGKQKGYKGRIFDFDLVKKTFYESDYDKIKELTTRQDEIESYRKDIFENLDEDLQRELGKGNDSSDFDAKKLKAYIKSSDNKDLKKVVEELEETKGIAKEIKGIEATLNEKAKEMIPVLTEEQIDQLLTRKWLEPLFSALNEVLNKTLSDYITKLSNLKEKYSDSLADINKEIESTSNSLKDMMKELTGNEADMKALELLMNVL